MSQVCHGEGSKASTCVCMFVCVCVCVCAGDMSNEVIACPPDSLFLADGTLAANAMTWRDFGLVSMHSHQGLKDGQGMENTHSRYIAQSVLARVLPWLRRGLLQVALNCAWPSALFDPCRCTAVWTPQCQGQRTQYSTC